MVDTTIELLETPKRLSLSTRANSLRTSLKDWEKSFAASHNHRKPDKDDIKACPEIARTYKEYNRVRDVLMGKLPVEVPNSPTQQKRTSLTTSHVTRSSIDGEASSEHRCTPKRKDRKSSHTHPSDPYDALASASPGIFPETSIGPTPQRDGKVLGLFDMLSGRRTHSTPSTRKRKIDTLMEGPRLPQVGVVAQTPTKDRRQLDSDRLDHVDGTPQSSAKRQRHSRTPASAGKKFMLSHFFATPSSVQTANVGQNLLGKALDSIPQSFKTPLRTHVLSNHVDAAGKDLIPSPDATPAYLRRSHSFKDRLLSVTSKQTISEQHPSGPKHVSTCPTRSNVGPRALQRCKSAPKPLSEIVRGLQKIEDECHDDDLEALRELEGVQINILAGDSQHDEVVYQSPQDVQPTSEKVTTKVWKKKGQKRTTKRSHMRPVKMQLREDSRLDVEDNGEDDDTNAQVVEERQPGSTGSEDDPEHGFDGRLERTTNDRHRRDGAQRLSDGGCEEAGSDHEPEEQPDTSALKRRKLAKLKVVTGGGSARPKKSTSKEEEKTGPTINPNAVSHMNFRSLKIKNKNSKGKGGRAKFGRKAR